MATIGRYGAAFAASLAATSLANALLFIAKESSPALMAWMQRATGHHWLTQGALVLALFLALGFAVAGLAPAPAGRPDGKALTLALVASVLTASALIVGFLLP